MFFLYSLYLTMQIIRIFLLFYKNYEYKFNDLQIKCMKCQSKSERHERIMDLTVEIEGDIGTLEEALQKFTSTEMLDGENKYHCSRLVGLLLKVFESIF